MRSIRLFIAIFMLFCVTAMPASASTVFDLDVISTPTIGSGTLGTVTLNQISATQVDVVVSLAENTAFVRTGGPHNAFAYSLNLDPSDYVVTITSAEGFFTLMTGISNTPYGDFTDGMYCSGCGKGGSDPVYDPLMFSVIASGGISIANFVGNDLGYFFSADVIGPAGGTGNIAAVPLPAALPLLVGGLIGMGGAGAWLKKRKAV